MVHVIHEAPLQFLSGLRNGKRVKKTVSQDFSSTQSPSQLQPLAIDGKIIIPITHLSIPPIKVLRTLQLPPSFLIRWDCALNKDVQKHLVRLWDNLLLSGITGQSLKDKNRSNSHSFHLGIWEITSLKPHLTRETHHQSPKAIQAIDKLLKYIKDFVAPCVTHFMKEDAPDQLKILER